MGSLRGRPATLHATEVTGLEVPELIDELPMIAVLGARAEGVTRITGAKELRYKESDRIAALAENLRKLGVDADELEDGIEVSGTDRPLQGRVRTRGDHRIAMAFGVLGALPGNRITIDDPDAADVSFPGFWQLLRQVTEGANA
jgi:3-phosphoshikimate 1-carboxyvinyltransferase